MHKGITHTKLTLAKYWIPLLLLVSVILFLFSPSRKIPKYFSQIFHSHFIARNCITFLYMLHKRSWHTDGAVHGTIHTAHTTYATALKTTTHPKTRYRKPYAATQHLMLLMVGVCTRNMSS